MESVTTSFRNDIVYSVPDEFADRHTGSDVSEDRLRHLQELLEESDWARVEAEHRVTALEEELRLAKRRELDHKEMISQLEFDLSEARCMNSRLNSIADASRKNSLADPIRKDSLADISILPPPPEFRTKSKSCTQLLAATYESTSFPGTSLSVGDIDPDQDDDVFADPVGGSSVPGSAGVKHGVELQRNHLAKVLAKEICRFNEDLVLANKTISDSNKSIIHYTEICSQCPLRAAIDMSLPSHIRGFCVKIQDLLDDRVWDFSLNLVADHVTLTNLREELDFYEDFSGLFWSVVSEWNRKSRGSRRTTLLAQLIRACAECDLQNPLNVEPVSLEDMSLLEELHPLFNTHLLISPTLIYLRDSGLLSSPVVTYILEHQDPAQQIITFLDVMPIFGARALDILIRAVRRSDQGHLADIIQRNHPDRFHDPPDSPTPQPRHVPVLSGAKKSPRVENSIKMFPQQTLETNNKKNFFRRPKWLFRSGKYKFNK